ncbi:RNA polymerase sigma factor [Niastella vici]|uniref:RNA polymerase sigma factor n=1 Tax=Niastella vici TaxID=1703345 RepID=UPI001C1FA8D4|nr:sigma-70 family RNA polymerase sigma factor [Niastella vici]
MYNVNDDNELFALVKKDNELAYTELYNRYWQKLYFVAHKHLKSDSEAREIVQEVFFTIWAKRRSLAIESFPAYIASMARYAVYVSLARKKRQAEKISEEAIQQQTLPAALADLLENKWLLEKISALSTALPEKCRLVFIKNKLLDQSLSQVAADLDISQKTAEAHLTKALKIMRDKLGDVAFFLML